MLMDLDMVWEQLLEQPALLKWLNDYCREHEHDSSGGSAVVAPSPSLSSPSVNLLLFKECPWFAELSGDWFRTSWSPVRGTPLGIYARRS
jgi:hypothetical protein